MAENIFQFETNRITRKVLLEKNNDSPFENRGLSFLEQEISLNKLLYTCEDSQYEKKYVHVINSSGQRCFGMEVDENRELILDWNEQFFLSGLGHTYFTEVNNPKQMRALIKRFFATRSFFTDAIFWQINEEIFSGRQYKVPNNTEPHNEVGE